MIDDMQIQNKPVDITPEDDDAMEQLIELAKQTRANLSELDERLKLVENRMT